LISTSVFGDCADFYIKAASFFGETVLPMTLRVWLAVPQNIRSYIYRKSVCHLPNSYRLAPNVQKLPFGLILKHGPRSENEEAALRVVSKHTAIPAPSLVDFVSSDNRTYLLMTEITGKTLERVLNSLSDPELLRLAQDLKSVISELRSIPSGGAICGAAGNISPCHDFRLPDDRCGPFASESLFNDYLVSCLPEEDRSTLNSYCQHSIFFTHGDLVTRNIIMESGRLKGIVDWECAGFFPEYWEKTKAIFSCTHPDWVRLVDDVLDGYEPEIEREKRLWEIGSPF
jgi:tRNA A-37 threonylcarbamoyl transferase component Bud32